MRLELNILEIKEVRFGEETSVRDDALRINGDESRQCPEYGPRAKKRIEAFHARRK